MVVLAVKLNSTYLDNLGLFDPKDLYGRACEEKVIIIEPCPISYHKVHVSGTFPSMA